MNCHPLPRRRHQLHLRNQIKFLVNGKAQKKTHNRLQSNYNIRIEKKVTQSPASVVETLSPPLAAAALSTTTRRHLATNQRATRNTSIGYN